MHCITCVPRVITRIHVITDIVFWILDHCIDFTDNLQCFSLIRFNRIYDVLRVIHIFQYSQSAL